jgi:imidazolonepropionase
MNFKAFINIKSIFGAHSKDVDFLKSNEMLLSSEIQNAFVLIENGRFFQIGKMEDYIPSPNFEVIDLKGFSMLPTYCDSHTHIVFAAPREHEFEMKIQGKTYQEIADAGGGIINSAIKLSETPFDMLLEDASNRLHALIKMGTGAIEIKSGYGLSIESELKMLRVIKALKEKFPIPIKATFLGAHAVPKTYNSNQDYIEEVIFPILPIINEEQLADYIDIFIEKNYFSIEDAKEIIDESKKYNLKPKLHVNQLNNFGALQFAIDENAISVDHLEEVSEQEINYLKDKATVPTLLPSCSFFIKIPYAPARNMIDSGLGIALASDFNPGSTPSGNMNFVWSLACIYQKMLPVEAFNALTINGAKAMELEKEVGSIAVGKKANFIISKKINSLASIPYSFGEILIEKVFINGNEYN